MLPPWMPTIGIEGGRINIVPVDFVADALDYLAHKKGLDGKCFHLTDPEPYRDRRGAQHLRPRRARAADDHAHQCAHVRLHSGADPVRHRVALAGQADDSRGAERSRHPEGRVPVHQLADALRQPRGDQGAQGLGDRGAAARVATRRRLWDYWERNLDPDLFIDRSLSGRVKDRVVVVTGASSGIGKATALKLAAAGAKVMLVARGEEKLVETKKEIEEAGGKAWHLRVRRLRHGRMRRAGRESAQASTAPATISSTTPGRSIRRGVHQLVRPLPRLRAHDAAQLFRRAAADHGLPAEDGRAETRAHHQHLVDRRAVERAAVLGLRRVEVGARFVLPPAPHRNSSTRASTSPRSTCRWCARR